MVDYTERRHFGTYRHWTESLLNARSLMILSGACKIGCLPVTLAEEAVRSSEIPLMWASQDCFSEDCQRFQICRHFSLMTDDVSGWEQKWAWPGGHQKFASANAIGSCCNISQLVVQPGRAFVLPQILFRF